MSSNLKDARWQLAESMAQDDGFDFYEMEYFDKEEYLQAAQEQLDYYDTEQIDALAEQFRKQG